MRCQNTRIATSKAVELPFIWTDVVLNIENSLMRVSILYQYIFGNFKETL